MPLPPPSMPVASPLPFDHAPDGPVRLYALIPSAGSGSRSGAAGPKQYQRLAGQRVIDHTVQAFLQVGLLSGVGVVVAPDDRVYASADPRVRVWHVGGATRAHSVYNGLLALAGSGARGTDWVLVHDAARCLIRPHDIERLIQTLMDDPVGGLLALPLPDTLKQASPDTPDPRVTVTVPRSDKWLAQTPQMFRIGALTRALQADEASGFDGITDEASAIERAGMSPKLVAGPARNVKVTYPEDFALAEALLMTPQMTPSTTDMTRLRIGEGWDVHALVPGRRLMLGGIHIPHHSGLLGHSDADALLHAITDALLGAAALGDIGTLFPDHDPQFEGADSSRLLAHAWEQVTRQGYALANLDATVIAQAPRLGAYKTQMQTHIANLLGVRTDQVNIKAKTAEKLGPVGQGLSIECRAVALLVKAG